MRIINVINLIDGVLHSIDSFPIFEEQLSQERVQEAEQLFAKYLQEKGDLTPEEIDGIIESDSGYDDNNGFEVFIHWSNVNL